MLSLWLLEQQSPVLLNEWTLLKGHFLNLEALLKLWSTFSFLIRINTKMCVNVSPRLLVSDTTAGSPKKISSTRDCWLHSTRSKCLC